MQKMQKWKTKLEKSCTKTIKKVFMEKIEKWEEKLEKSLI